MEDILTVTLANDFKSLVKPRAFLTLLQLCTVMSPSVRRMLSCNDAAFWEQVYLHLKNTTKFHEQLIRDLISPPNGQGVAVYKRKCIEFVVYRILDDQVGLPSTAAHISGPVQTFLSRTNGSVKNVVKGVRTWVQKVRQRDPHFPPIPSDFVVAIVEGTKKIEVRHRGRQHCNGLDNFPQLIDALKEERFY